MTKAWKQFDLDGGGLQSVNLILSRAMRKRQLAYGWWLLFPVGAHRFYLAERIGAGVFVALSALALFLFVFVNLLLAGLAVGILILWALFDLIWIDRRVTAYNKKIRMQLYLRASAPPPAGYRGRVANLDAEELITDYAREKERERGGHLPDGSAPPDIAAPTPSFRQQEALLRELSRSRRKRPPPES